MVKFFFFSGGDIRFHLDQSAENSLKPLVQCQVYSILHFTFHLQKKKKKNQFLLFTATQEPNRMFSGHARSVERNRSLN